MDDEYMMGESILCASFINSSSVRNVYLPAGNWYDLYNNKKYHGDSTYQISMGLNKLPMKKILFCHWPSRCNLFLIHPYLILPVKFMESLWLLLICFKTIALTMILKKQIITGWHYRNMGKKESC